MNTCNHCKKQQYYIRIKDNKQICHFCGKEIKREKPKEYTSIKDSAGIVRV